ncbi:hypothetical protein GLOIN_2v1500014 [Rhizophagus irregularis DAOM 181602=DAOM 197198]|uniref:Protein kinase domain-containing protein n=1 Tax=Rhizophagus irregularis (strain DAOM 181602 / DAOM 197198 / MUCL 43194) TaxID=747089 RepID=A0A2P4QXB4_RHIID|nr:hypothetical protein GLOIN_2v1500014 [Rhizophagus irregularis DAOM 181602=DAOM 197198]POG82218.1 hypothetical protein GLOIN_2v1500014 [Rhizophagus irregularis DAOM 181602=DAOM 197198]|eukprot:XP_025189084.1 hypothetical protein GLOIN_2v1500014 [Rhizophagus irregularis DAOM 181602=DAOM 197198]
MPKMENCISIGPFTEHKAASYISQIADALVYLQKKKVIHRVMKPENILLPR